MDQGAWWLEGIRMCISHSLDRKDKQYSILFTHQKSLTDLFDWINVFTPERQAYFEGKYAKGWLSRLQGRGGQSLMALIALGALGKEPQDPRSHAKSSWVYRQT